MTRDVTHDDQNVDETAPLLNPSSASSQTPYNTDGERRLSIPNGAPANPLEESFIDPASNVKPTNRSWFTLPQFKPSPYIILPPLFIHALAVSFGMTPFNQFLLLNVCQAIGGQPSPISSTKSFINNTTIPFLTPTSYFLASGAPSEEGYPDYELCAARPDVQSESARWSQLISLSTSLPAFIVAPLVGYFIDRLGRKLMMLIPLFSALIGFASIIVVARLKVSLWLLVIVHFFQGLLGGSAILITCVYAYLADTTSSTSRTKSFLFTDAFTFTAFTIGPFAGGVVYRALGVVRLFEIAALMECAVFAYVLFILPESMKQEPRSGDTKEEKSPFKIFSGAWWSVLDVLGTPGRGYSVRILSLVTAVGAMVFAGYQYVLGLFSLTNSICRLFYLVILLPYLLRKWTIGKTSVEKTRLELGIVRVGILLYCLGFVAFGLANEGWLFYLIALIDGFGVTALPTVRAILSRTVPNTSQGKLFSALEMLQSGSSLLSQLLIPIIYRKTVQTFPQAICFVVASIWALALALTAFVKSRELVSLTDAEAEMLGEETGWTTGTETGEVEEHDEVTGMDEDEAVNGEIEAEIVEGLYIPKPLIPSDGDQLPILSYIISLPVILCCGAIAGPVGFTFSTLCLGVAAYLSFAVIRPQDLNITAANLYRLQGILLAIVISSLILIVTQEQKERAFQELERANKEKSAFMAFLCHELRNPLHAIMNVGAFLKEQNDTREKGMGVATYIEGRKGIDEDEAAMCDAICESSRYMVDLINDVLDTSKFEAGKVQLDHRPCNLSHILSSVVLPVREHLKVKGVEFNMEAQFDSKGDIRGGLPAMVEMDGTRFKQVLTNLLSNAVKFTPEGGSVGLSVKVDDLGATRGESKAPSGPNFSHTTPNRATSRSISNFLSKFFPRRLNSKLATDTSASALEEILVAESLESPQHPSRKDPNTNRTINLVITLTDTGPGIPPEHIPSLFRPYNQAPTPYTKLSQERPKSKIGIQDVGSKVGEMRGTGLGLSIVKQIVDLWSGEVSVQSTLDVGSTFSVVLPVVVCGGQVQLDELPDSGEKLLSAKPPGVARTDSVDTVASPSADTLELGPSDPVSPRPLAPQQIQSPPRSPSPSGPQKMSIVPPVAPSADPPRQPSPPSESSLATSALATKQKLPPSYDFAHLRVLIVDDSSMNRKILSKLMHILGVKNIHESSNGLEALQAVCGASLTLKSLSSTPPFSISEQNSASPESSNGMNLEKFDIIFMDVQMPVLDGTESTRFMRLWGCKTPIVAVTGNHISDKDGFLKHGFDALAPKPFLKADAERLLRSMCLERDPGSR
ncbi:Histidine kinase [Chytridiales sp. JEL 0842]|nr:Histidine kinase [Chytridiales sp. JEL 0842]